MATDELNNLWNNIRSHLLRARENLREEECRSELVTFDEYVQHNELELALDMLEIAFGKVSSKSSDCLRSMAEAAEIMGLSDRANAYRAQIGSDLQTNVSD